MATKKSTAKPRGATHSRTKVRDEIATPAQVLGATVRLIGDRARTRPINRLIGDTPSQTIETCKSVIDWLVHVEKPFADAELDAAEAHILRTVADALAHAEDETRCLWRAAKGMAEVANG
jgi:hypothetical protein